MENKISLDRIQYRVGQTYYEADKKRLKGVSFLIYIDARTAQEQMDEKFKPENWAFKWEKVDGNQWAVKGIMTVKMDKDSGWIVREDVGYPQENKKKNWLYTWRKGSAAGNRSLFAFTIKRSSTKYSLRFTGRQSG